MLEYLKILYKLRDNSQSFTTASWVVHELLVRVWKNPRKINLLPTDSSLVHDSPIFAQSFSDMCTKSWLEIELQSTDEIFIVENVSILWGINFVLIQGSQNCCCGIDKFAKSDDFHDLF